MVGTRDQRMPTNARRGQSVAPGEGASEKLAWPLAGADQHFAHMGAAWELPDLGEQGGGGAADVQQNGGRDENLDQRETGP